MSGRDQRPEESAERIQGAAREAEEAQAHADGGASQEQAKPPCRGGQGQRGGERGRGRGGMMMKIIWRRMMCRALPPTWTARGVEMRPARQSPSQKPRAPRRRKRRRSRMTMMFLKGKFAPGTKARENAFAGVCSNAKTLLNEKFDKDLTLTFPKDLSEPSGSTLLCSRARHPFVFLFRWFVDEHQPRNDMTMWIRTLSKECLHTLQDVQAAVQMPGNLLHYSVTVFVDSTTAANT